MQVLVKKWGNSAAVRIPSAIMTAARLQVNIAVDVCEEGGRIIIESVVPVQLDLESLLAGITPANIHGEMSFGRPLGKETL